VRPHWRNAAAAPVNLLTARNPNQTFRDSHHSGKRPLVREPTRKAALARDRQIRARGAGGAQDGRGERSGIAEQSRIVKRWKT